MDHGLRSDMSNPTLPAGEPEKVDNTNPEYRDIVDQIIITLLEG